MTVLFRTQNCRLLSTGREDVSRFILWTCTNKPEQHLEADFSARYSFTSSGLFGTIQVGRLLYFKIYACALVRYHEDITDEGLDNNFILHRHYFPRIYRNYQDSRRKKLDRWRGFVSHASFSLLPRKYWKLLQHILYHRWNRKWRSLLVLLYMFQKILYSNLFQEQMEMPEKSRGAKTPRWVFCFSFFIMMVDGWYSSSDGHVITMKTKFLLQHSHRGIKGFCFFAG